MNATDNKQLAARAVTVGGLVATILTACGLIPKSWDAAVAALTAILIAVLSQLPALRPNHLSEGVRIKVNTIDTNQYLVSLQGVDIDGIETGPIAAATCTVDNPALASVTPDPSTQGQFIVAPIKQTTPVAALGVGATLTDPATSLSATIALGWTAGAPVTVNAVATVQPIPAPAPPAPTTPAA